MPPQKQPTGTPLSKSEAVYRELRGRIVAGRYVAGYRIVLDQIAREMGVSPVPVREAIRRLEAERLVTFTRNVGAEVASIDVEDYADAMQTLAYLEGAATSLAAQHLDEELLEDAIATNEQMRSLVNSGEFDSRLFTDLNTRFHRQLATPCPNHHMFEILEREWERVAVIRRGGLYRLPGRSRVSVEEHDGILALISAGASTEQIEMAARNHKLRSMRDFIKEREANAQPAT
ncbi:MAG TPA: GntR family transcriptional regulator [Actinomycetales bacterium]|nr:GntR family transcriptional regulator [Actinomycetales bacterium]